MLSRLLWFKSTYKPLRSLGSFQSGELRGTGREVFGVNDLDRVEKRGLDGSLGPPACAAANPLCRTVLVLGAFAVVDIWFSQ